MADRRAQIEADLRVRRYDLCPTEVYDAEGDGGPCDATATDWCWYDGGEHEPMLYRSCWVHSTDGGRAIAQLLDALAEAEAERDALRDRALAAEAKMERVEAVVTDWGAGTVHRPRSTYYGRLRAALAGEDA